MLWGWGLSGGFTVPHSSLLLLFFWIRLHCCPFAACLHHLICGLKKRRKRAKRRCGGGGSSLEEGQLRPGHPSSPVMHVGSPAGWPWPPAGSIPWEKSTPASLGVLLPAVWCSPRVGNVSAGCSVGCCDSACGHWSPEMLLLLVGMTSSTCQSWAWTPDVEGPWEPTSVVIACGACKLESG